MARTPRARGGSKVRSRRCGIRGWRGRRRSASAARGRPARRRRRASPRRALSRRASSAGSRLATAEQLPTATPAWATTPAGVELDQHRHHGDRDHQVASAAELQEHRARPGGARRNVDRAHQLGLAPRGPAAAEHEVLERQPPRRPRRCAARPRRRARQRRHAIGRRRGVADVAGNGAGVLDLHAADLAGRGRRGRRRAAAGRPGSRRSRWWWRRGSSPIRCGECHAVRRRARGRAPAGRSAGRRAPDRGRCRRQSTAQSPAASRLAASATDRGRSETGHRRASLRQRRASVIAGTI